MKNNDIPYLCGGIFFVLLLQVKKPRTKPRDKFKGGSDGLADTDVLYGLMNVVAPATPKPHKDSFSKLTSEYKSCKDSGGTYIPFDDDRTIQNFDNDIKRKYSSALQRMSAFTDKHLNTHETEFLVKALLATIEEDKEIKATDMFYIEGNGNYVSKKDISTVTNITLESFLLGVLHYIITNRPNNKLGRKTYEAWHERPSSQRAVWKFNSEIGTNVTRSLNISLLALSDENTQTSEATPEMDMQDNDSIDNESVNVINQYINNPTVVNQYGEKSVHIDHLDTLNL